MPFVLSSNRMISWLAGIFAAYWVFGLMADPMNFSVLVSASMLVGGIMVSIRAVPDAVGIIKKGQIGPGELAVIALALISTGAVWTGTFNIIYSNYGRPETWIGPFSSYGRAHMALGFFTLFLSPDATRQGIKWPRWYFLLTAFVMIAVLSFLLGYSFSAPSISD